MIFHWRRVMNQRHQTLIVQNGDHMVLALLKLVMELIKLAIAEVRITQVTHYRLRIVNISKWVESCVSKELSAKPIRLVAQKIIQIILRIIEVL